MDKKKKPSQFLRLVNNKKPASTYYAFKADIGSYMQSSRHPATTETRPPSGAIGVGIKLDELDDDEFIA